MVSVHGFFTFTTSPLIPFAKSNVMRQHPIQWKLTNYLNGSHCRPKYATVSPVFAVYAIPSSSFWRCWAEIPPKPNYSKITQISNAQTSKQPKLMRSASRNSNPLRRFLPHEIHCRCAAPKDARLAPKRVGPRCQTHMGARRQQSNAWYRHRKDCRSRAGRSHHERLRLSEYAHSQADTAKAVIGDNRKHHEHATAPGISTAHWQHHHRLGTIEFSRIQPRWTNDPWSLSLGSVVPCSCFPSWDEGTALLVQAAPATDLIAVYRVELRSLRDAPSRANQRAQVNAPENASRYGIWALIDCP